MTEEEYEELLYQYAEYVDICMTGKMNEDCRFNTPIFKRALAIVMMEIESQMNSNTYKEVINHIVNKYESTKPILFLAGQVIQSIPRIMEEIKEQQQKEE